MRQLEQRGVISMLQHTLNPTAREREALAVRQAEALALAGLSPSQRVMVDEIEMHPDLACREEVVGLMAAAPSAYWVGFAHAIYLTRLGLSEATGREF